MGAWGKHISSSHLKICFFLIMQNKYIVKFQCINWFFPPEKCVLENIRLKKVIVLAQMGSGAKHPFSRGVKICLKKE